MDGLTLGFADELQKALKPIVDLIVDERMNVRVQDELEVKVDGTVDVSLPYVIDTAILETAAATGTISAALATGLPGIITATETVAATVATGLTTQTEALGEILALESKAINENITGLRTEALDSTTRTLEGIDNATNHIVASIVDNSDSVATRIEEAVGDQTDSLVESGNQNTVTLDRAITRVGTEVTGGIESQTLGLEAALTGQTTELSGAIAASATAISGSVAALGTDLDGAIAASTAAIVTATGGVSVAVGASILAQTTALTAVNPIPLTSNLNDISNHLQSLLGPLEGVQSNTNHPIPVTVNNIPGTFPVTGTVSISGQPVEVEVVNPQPPSSSVTVTNFPSTYPVTGTIGVNNLPSSYPVTGSVSVSNFPTTQEIHGHVSVDAPLEAQVTNWPGPNDPMYVVSGQTLDVRTVGVVRVEPDSVFPVYTRDGEFVNVGNNNYMADGQQPLPVTLVQPNTASEMPNLEPYSIKMNSGWKYAQARPVTAVAFLDENRLNVT